MKLLLQVQILLPEPERIIMRIVHFSDFHGHWRNLPEAELYICTGDMLHNYGTGKYGHIEPVGESLKQTEWLNQEKLEGGLRQYLGTLDAPVVLVRGNHDFVEYGEFFGGEYFEINDDPTRTVEYFGFKIGGFRGIPWMGGTWSDELDQPERAKLIEALPTDLDIVVSHPPPTGILADKWGCTEYTRLVQRWMHKEREDKPKLCCFGHIHEDGCMTKELHGILFSNASLGWNELEMDDEGYVWEINQY